MNKKYQVFVSSTYQDLSEERKEVIQALLELDCIPVGMEIFPATDDEQWKLIKELIDDCDYYILIIGGRYGSENNEGKSYTQMEYEYACQIGVPTISFLPKSAENTPIFKTDRSSEKEVKLENFKTLVQQKMVKYWSTPEDLGSVVSRSLIKLIRTKPRTGWVKADSVSSMEANLEILRLREQLQKIEEEIKNEDIIKLENLSQGHDLFIIFYSIYKRNIWKKETIELSWNEIFAMTCPLLIVEAKEESYEQHLSAYIAHKLDVPQSGNVQIVTDSFMNILIQFKALGLIEKSIKTRSVKDSSTYWKLTIKGDNLLTQLRAVRKKTKDKE